MIKQVTTVKQRNMMRVIALIVAGFIVLFSVYKGFAYASNVGQQTPKDYIPVLVEVQYGDTAWNIQKKLTPKADTRELIYYVTKINERDMKDIYPGESLIFLREDVK